MKQLTKNQAENLTGGKHWSEKKQHLIKLAKSFGIIINNDQELQYLIEIHVPNEIKRLHQVYLNECKTGIRKTELTPTDVKGTFKPVKQPIIGMKYHISWAYSGAVFKLVSIEEAICYLDNPKYKRDKLLKCNVSELRHLATK